MVEVVTAEQEGRSREGRQDGWKGEKGRIDLFNNQHGCSRTAQKEKGITGKADQMRDIECKASFPSLDGWSRWQTVDRGQD